MRSTAGCNREGGGVGRSKRDEVLKLWEIQSRETDGYAET